MVFGNFIGNPIEFRVLDIKTSDFGSTTMFLDCDSTYNDVKFNPDTSDVSNVWQDSPLRKMLNGNFLNCFSDKEQAAIYNSQNPSSHESWEETWETHPAYGKLHPDGDKIFILDAREAEHEAYGYFHTDDDAKSRDKSKSYWLRSPLKADSNYVIFVNPDGNLAVSNSDSNLGVSPALNLDLSAVLFSTVKFEDKSIFSETKVPTNLHNNWVLTLSSGDTGFKAVRTNPEEIITAGAGGNVKLSLSGAMSGANQISAMLLDSNNTVLRYGKISEQGVF